MKKLWSVLIVFLVVLSAHSLAFAQALRESFKAAEVVIYENDYAGIYLSGTAAKLMFDNLKVEGQELKLEDGTLVATYRIGENLVCAEPADLVANEHTCRVNFEKFSEGKAYNYLKE